MAKEQQREVPPANPFRYGAIARGEFFTDRSAELEQLASYPAPDTQWNLSIRNPNNAQVTFNLYLICAAAP